MKKTSLDRIQRTLTLQQDIDNLLREKAAKLKMPISHLAERAIAAYLQDSQEKEGNGNVEGLSILSQ